MDTRCCSILEDETFEHTTSATICSSISIPDNNWSFFMLISYDEVGVTNITRLFLVCNIFAITSWKKDMGSCDCQISERKKAFAWKWNEVKCVQGHPPCVCTWSDYHVIWRSTDSRRFPAWMKQRMHLEPINWPMEPTFLAQVVGKSLGLRVQIVFCALANECGKWKIT